jgi:hypothetical protein
MGMLNSMIVNAIAPGRIEEEAKFLDWLAMV